jgi:DeoR family deoxyribose operon repressor
MERMDDRLKSIVKEIGANGVMSIKQLADILNVSEMTIRRDISRLEKENQVSVFYGGVTLCHNRDKALPEAAGNGSEKDYSFERALSRQTNEKMRIAKKAASLLEPSDVLMIDTGSTCSMIVDYIGDESDHIVYTYSINVFNKCIQKDNLRTVLCGGYYHDNIGMFESAEGAAQLKKAYFNKAFFACMGVTDNVGITAVHSCEVLMRRSALGSSRQKILLADSTKLGKAWYAKYADLTEMDIVITDDKITSEHLKMLENSGVKVLVV